MRTRTLQTAVSKGMKLEDLQANTAVRGVLPEGLATVVGVQWFGSEALENDRRAGTDSFAPTVH